MGENSEATSVEQQLGEMNQLLSRVMMQIARASDGKTSLVLRDLTQVTSTLNRVQSAVNDQMQVRDRQVGALAEIGSVINSSLGLKRVLAEVMDRLVSLMNAERGFLMLKEPNGELKVQVARGIEQVDLNENEFAISMTVVRQVAATGQVILTTNAQNDPRFDQQLSVAAYHLLSILCAPLKPTRN